jgi:hypothetical protein
MSGRCRALQGNIWYEMKLCISKFFDMTSPTEIQVLTNFDTRESLKRETAYQREVLDFCAFCLDSQAECTTISGIVL